MVEFQVIIFYAFSALILISATSVILVSNPVYSAFFLILAFIASAGVWLLLHAEFLAIVLVLVYVGAVMVLFLFVLMMLDINLERLREGFWRYLPFAVVVAALLVWGVIHIVTNRDFTGGAAFGGAPLSDEENTRALGAVLYTDYVYPFELAAVVLLVAIVAAVALTLRRRGNVKHNDPAEQTRASPRQRLKIVSMPSAPRAQDEGGQIEKTSQ